MPFTDQNIEIEVDLGLPLCGGIDRASCRIGHVVWLREYSDKLARMFSEAGLEKEAAGHPVVIVGLSSEHDKITISLVSWS